MTAGDDAAESWANQGIDHWAQHGVEELTERAAEDRAELGEHVEAADQPAAGRWDGTIQRD